MATWLTIGLLGLTYLALFAMERRLPLRAATASLVPRLRVNVVVSATAFIAAALLVRPATEAMLDRSGTPFGLVPLAGLAGVAEIVAVFLLMDLTFYYWHIANHRVPLLWRFHNAHHIDPDLDVSTGFRFHFVEVGFSALFRAIQVTLIGPTAAAFLVYEIAFQTFTLFHHTNWRLPESLERALVRIIVTPRMHGIHHSDFRDETNSNFGVVFSWWDRLHGTVRLDVPQHAIVIGIPGYARAEDNRVLRCLALPFQRQRDYWQGRLHRESPAAGRGTPAT
jgi:sterol desaturase/sphingolipid hydroxylase (fatty acid hydroxylase superfamily)